MENYNGYQELANAIVAQAAKDYMKAKKRLMKHPKNTDALDEIKECTRFFHSSWYQFLTKIDGDYLIAQLDKAVMA